MRNGFRNILALVGAVAMAASLTACSSTSAEKPQVKSVVKVGETYTKADDALIKAGLKEGKDYETDPGKSDARHNSLVNYGDLWKISAVGKKSGNEPVLLRFAKTHPKSLEELSLVGQSWPDAQAALNNSQWDEEDYAVKTTNGKTVLLAANWQVSKVTEGKNPVITLTPIKEKAEDSSSDSTSTDDSASTGSDDSSTKDATKSGLTATYATAACDARGKQEYSYFNPSHVFGTISENVMDNNIFLQYTAKVKDASGTKTKVTVTCNVRGTNNAPEVFGWLVN
jgi:hypothetical protein